MAKSEFSVIIPFKFGSKFAKQCFQSVARAFNDFDFEVLVILDEPSASERRRLISAVEIWRNKCNLRISESPGHGISAALNYGIELSQSDVLVRHDIDDLCFKWRGERLAKFMQSGPDFVFGSIVAIPIPVYSCVPKTREEAISIASERNPFFHPATAFTKCAIEKLGGYNSESDRLEDYDLWIRTLETNQRICLDPIPHTKYRKHRFQYTRQKRNHEVESIRNELQQRAHRIAGGVNYSATKGSIFRALKYLYMDHRLAHWNP